MPTPATRRSQLSAKWPIRYKLLLGLALLLVIVAALSTGGIVGLYSYRSLVKSLSWRATELPLADDLSRQASDMRVTLGESRLLHRFGKSGGKEPPADGRMLHEQFDTRLDLFRQTLAKYQYQLEGTERRRLNIGDGHRERATVEKIETSLARIGDVARDTGWMFNEISFARADAELDELQRLTAVLPSFLHKRMQNMAGEVRLQYRTLIILAWVNSVLVVVMLPLFVKLFYGWIFRPLRLLVEGSRRVAAGRFDHRIQLATDDEMSELADAMNEMTSRFESVRDDLDAKVQERTRQAVRSERLASVGFLAAGVAHEINNPLASIAMCAESLEGRLENGFAGDEQQRSVAKNYLRMIQEEAFRCKDITEKLLDFSRRGDEQRQPADLRGLVEGVIGMVSHLGKYQDRRIEVVVGEAVVAPVNQQEIKQVTLNLLTNALDSLKPGGTVKIEVVRRGGHAEVVFADDGCGMTGEVLEHLFEPFFTRRRGGQGTGLGLAIAYRIVADHCGDIQAKSEGPGKGSKFTVRLPLGESKTEVQHRHQAA